MALLLNLKILQNLSPLDLRKHSGLCTLKSGVLIFVRSPFLCFEFIYFFWKKLNCLTSICLLIFFRFNLQGMEFSSEMINFTRINNRFHICKFTNIGLTFI